MLAADGPQLVLDGWVAWLGFIGLVCGTLVGVATAWRKVFRPLLHGAALLDESLPTLVQIARNYTDDHGGEALTAELAGLARNQGAVAENQRLITSKLDAHSAKLDAGLAKLDELHTYSHTMRHDIIGDVSRLSATWGTATTIVDALAETAAELRAVREALVRHDDGPT